VRTAWPVFAAVLALIAVTVAHIELNLGGAGALYARAMAETERRTLVIGHLPVTCHLTCPVTAWVSEHSATGTRFESKKYTNFAAMTEDMEAGNLQAAFLLAPLAMVLERKGTEVRIVHLGHRDGTALVVKKDSAYQSFADLRGTRIGIPHRYSNQRILVERLKDQYHFSDSDVTLVDFPPPEMPNGLKTGQLDAYIVGEPFAAKSEMEGFGRVLAFTKDIWPNFISCVLVVTEDLVHRDPALVQELVDGIARSGMWLDQPGDDLAPGVVAQADAPSSPEEAAKLAILPDGWEHTHRVQAAMIASRAEFYNQDPALLRFVLTRPPDRVKYSNLGLVRSEFAVIQQYAERLGFFDFRPVTPQDPFDFDDYADASFLAKSAHE
jgi:NitT/TauT family transport system substrate-binding protein